MKNFYCIIFAIFLIFLINKSVFAVEYRYAKNGFKYAYHAHSESSYQHAWCAAHKGIEEYENKDKTSSLCLKEMIFSALGSKLCNSIILLVVERVS